MEGESECGKSSLLHLLAKLHKKEESMIVVHLGEQIDSKVQVLVTYFKIIIRMINILYIHNDNQQLYNPLIDVNLNNNLQITKI